MLDIARYCLFLIVLWRKWRTAVAAAFVCVSILLLSGTLAWIYYGVPLFEGLQPAANVRAVVSPGAGALTDVQMYETCRVRALELVNEAIRRYGALPDWKSGDRPQLGQEVDQAFAHTRGCEGLRAAMMENEEKRRKLDAQL